MRLRGAPADREADRSAAGRAARPVRRHPGAHVPLLLGARRSEDRPRARPLPEQVSVEHRGSRLCSHRLSDRRGERLRLSRRRRGPRARHVALLRQGPTGPGARRPHGIQGFLLPLPRHEDGPALGAGGGAVHHRHHPPAGRRALLSVLLRPSRRRRASHPRSGRPHLLPGGLELGGAAAADRQHGMASRGGALRRRVAHLRRVDDPVHPRPRLPHPPAGRPCVAGIHGKPQPSRVPGADARELRAALRPPVLPRLDRLSRPPRRLDGGQGPRLLRELASGDPRPTRLRHREPRWLEGLWAQRLGAHRLRRAPTPGRW